MKILIISHNPLSTNQSMGKTMLSLFSEFKKEELCQLYIYPTKPNVDKCNSYLRISDIDALKGIFKFKVCPTLVAADENFVAEKSIIYGNGKNRSHIRELLRDLVWKLSPWYNRMLLDWLRKEKPTHIFVAPGSGKFLFDIAIKISKEFNIPIITYICDDYYHLKNETTILGMIWQKGLRKKIRYLISQSKCVVTICHEMAVLYQNEFACRTQTIMTGASKVNNKINNKSENIYSITYMGNVSLNRYKSLVDIANALESISKTGTRCYLDVYTGNAVEEVQKAFSACRMLRLHGFVNGKEYEKVFENSEAFLHVEAFDIESIDRVKYSISTKIADILSSGKPVFAYGPQNIASISHLARNESAFVVSDKKELEKELLHFICNSEDRKQVISRALFTAEKFHNTSSVSNKMKDLFEKEIL